MAVQVRRLLNGVLKARPCLVQTGSGGVRVNQAGGVVSVRGTQVFQWLREGVAG